jgi:hypothetical protein
MQGNAQQKRHWMPTREAWIKDHLDRQAKQFSHTI